MSPRRPTPPDMNVVDRLSRGHPTTSTYADRLAAVRHLAAHGHTDQQIATLIRRSRRTVLRIRTDNDIPGQPLGTNRFTRPRNPAQ